MSCAQTTIVTDGTPNINRNYYNVDRDTRIKK